MEIRLSQDLADLTWSVADYLMMQANAAITARDVFHLAISGGSTPIPLFGLLALPEWQARTDWSKIHVYWADERCVPPQSKESNYFMANHALLSPIGLPEGNVHRIKGELDPQRAADEYNALIASTTLDMIMLGMGDDGHTASLFPQTTALTETERHVVANFVPQLNRWRVTLTLKAINAASEVLFMVAGASKQPVLAQVLSGEGDYPAKRIAPHSGKITWFVDQAAMGRVEPPTRL
ncbi:MAG: 6-phosphogluconolactonase [Anaerolineae bacterium]